MEPVLGVVYTACFRLFVALYVFCSGYFAERLHKGDDLRLNIEIVLREVVCR